MTEPRVFNGVDSVKAAVGEHLGYSEWLEITQERVNTFAEATGDFQWIHIDVERAKDGPFGGTIAHGYLTLSLASFFLPQIAVRGLRDGDQLRRRQGALRRARARRQADPRRAEMMEVTDVKGGGIQTKVLITIEIEGSERPACVIESISRWIP